MYAGLIRTLAVMSENNFAYCIKPSVKNVIAFCELFIDLNREINF